MDTVNDHWLNDLEKKHLKEMAKTIADFDKLCTFIILSYSANTLKDIMLRNFIAKSISQLKSVLHLVMIGQIQDCHIIFRSMLDRFAHVLFLERTNSYQEFDDWSFLKKFESDNNALSDNKFKHKVNKTLFTPSENDKIKYKSLKQNVKWQRPFVEEELKTVELGFLYKYGYNLSSQHVHPMANDGSIEYFRLLKNPIDRMIQIHKENSLTVLVNASIVSSRTISYCLNYSTFSWLQTVFDSVESFMPAIATKDATSFKKNILKLQLLAKAKVPICIVRTKV